MSVKFPFFGFFFGGGGKCRFYFYGRADFSDFRRALLNGLRRKMQKAEKKLPKAAKNRLWQNSSNQRKTAKSSAKLQR